MGVGAAQAGATSGANHPAYHTAEQLFTRRNSRAIRDGSKPDGFRPNLNRAVAVVTPTARDGAELRLFPGQAANAEPGTRLTRITKETIPLQGPPRPW
jgi:hypothetical protein